MKHHWFWDILIILVTVLAFFGLGAALLLLGATPLHAQAHITQGYGAFNYGYVTDSARVYLEQGWDEHNAFQVERGWCIEPADVEVDTAIDHSAVMWKVHHVTLPDSVSRATPYAISFSCSSTAIAAMHVHTNTTCIHNPKDPYGYHPKGCILGGDDAYLCSVDEADRSHARNDSFAVVQCGRGQFVFYWPNRRG